MHKLLTFVAISVFALSPGIANASLEEGLVLCFSFDQGETNAVRDLSGTGNNGVVNGNPKWAQGPGAKFGKAIELDGVSDYIEVADNDSLDVGDDDISMVLWIKHAAEQPNHPRPISKMPLYATDKPGFDVITVGSVSTKLQIFYGMSGAARQATDGGQDIADGEWHHLVVMKNENECKIYIDGELKTSRPITSMDISNDYPLVIGSNAEPKEHTMFKGVIDEVAVYNRALDEDEIKVIMENGFSLAVEAGSKLVNVWGQIKVD